MEQLELSSEDGGDNRQLAQPFLENCLPLSTKANHTRIRNECIHSPKGLGHNIPSSTI